MRKIIPLIGIVILLSLASQACYGQKMVIVKKDNGREITVRNNEIFELQLESHGGTGYIWGFEGSMPDYFEVLKEETKSESGTGMTGGPVTHIWTIKAKKPGTTEISMSFYRPWEGKDKAVDRFTVKLSILP
jgi:predicted secreted protein